jgi:hypothetical protein
MPVAYEGYWAKSIEAAIELVAGSAVFAALVAPTTAKNQIVEIDGGSEDEATPLVRACNGATFARTVALWAQVGAEAPEIPAEWISPQTIVRTVRIPVAFYWRPSGITYKHELIRYVLSKTGLIAAEIEAQAGGTGKWRRILAQFGGLTFLDSSGHARGTLRSQITLDCGDLP